MYLTHLMNNNPTLIELMIEYHQKGMIPPNTWVVDLDTIMENAKILSSEANRLGLETYLMSKQHNRNPYINKIALHNGLGKIVAVDLTCALNCKRYNIPLGHVGHLNQIPKHYIPIVMKMCPEIFTVYSFEQAQWINDAAKDQGIVQDIMIRVMADGDIAFPGQEAGFFENDFADFVQKLSFLGHVKLSGVTAFPCLTYNEMSEDRIQATPNLKTINRVVGQLEAFGFEITQVNTPGNTSSHVMALLKEYGATHVEPGNSLIGTTPSNAFVKDLPEKTAFAYLTEVSHFYEDRAYAYGGGVYHTNYSDQIHGLVGTNYKEAKENKINYKHQIKQDIDYHMQLTPEPGQRCEIGDSVIFAYRTQMHMTRSYVLPVSGLSGKKQLKLHYLFDNANTALDEAFNPVEPRVVIKDIETMLAQYQTGEEL